MASLIASKLNPRPREDDLPNSWWFASTAIPLLAATLGPLANMLSIAAIATKWRAELANNGVLPEGAQDLGTPMADPQWQLAFNGTSLGFGLLGNFIIMCNFTKRIRYVIAVPVACVLWLLAAGIVSHLWLHSAI
jgi:hypothetical protein